MAVANITSANVGVLYKPYAVAGTEANQGREPLGAAAAERAIHDSVEVSPLGRVAAEVVAARFSHDIDPQVFQARSAAFQGDLYNRFRAIGVDTTHAIELTTDFAGQVRVAHDHPHKDKIEALFADNADLSNEFRRLSATASLKQAFEDHLDFAKAYSKDPAAAITQFGNLFSSETSELRFLFAANEWVRRES